MTDTTALELADALRERYLIERELGRGGTAMVYLAQDLRHHRPVALKALHAASAEPIGPERFRREIETAARLQHPHILPLLDSGETTGRSGSPPPRLVTEMHLPSRIGGDRKAADRLTATAVPGLSPRAPSTVPDSK